MKPITGKRFERYVNEQGSGWLNEVRVVLDSTERDVIYRRESIPLEGTYVDADPTKEEFHVSRSEWERWAKLARIIE